MIRTIGALMLVLAYPAAAFAAAQMPPRPVAAPHCAAAMQSCDAMLKQLAEMDAKLQGLVDVMNAATGPAKVDRMAAVINELVAQRTVMARQLIDLQLVTVRHMSEHLEIGESIDDCPIIKEGETAPPHRIEVAVTRPN